MVELALDPPGDGVRVPGHGPCLLHQCVLGDASHQPSASQPSPIPIATTLNARARQYCIAPDGPERSSMLSCPPELAERIAANVAAVRAEIATACAHAGRDPASVRLIAVTKSQGPEVLAALAAAGLTDFGENRLDHLALMLPHAPAGARFHAIGRVQGRQLAGIAADCAALHSLCAPEHIARLSRACAAVGRRLPVFIQVNAAGEASKAGLAPADVPAFLSGGARRAAARAGGFDDHGSRGGPGGGAARRLRGRARARATGSAWRA